MTTPPLPWLQRAPDLVNEQGVKWWAIDLRDGVDIYLAELPDGERTYVVIDGGEVVHETPALDSAGTRAELLRHLRR